MATHRLMRISLAAVLVLAGALVAALAASVPAAEAEAPKATEAPAPTPPAPPAEKPAETPAPVEKPAETPAPAEKPAEAPAPAEKPAETPAPAEKPAEAPAPAEKPAEAPAPAEKPAEAPAPAEKPAEAPAPAVGTVGPKEIRFQFDGIPYNEVIRRFAQTRGKPIIGEYNVEGMLTFFDPRPYTVDEAFDTLNLILAMQGFAIVETDRYLRVVPMKEYTKAPVRIVRGWAAAEDLRPGELITLMLPLKFIAAEDAVRVLVPVVSSFGSVAPLGTGRGIILTDRADNLERIRMILEELDSSNLSADSVLKTYRMSHASATDVQKVIEDLFASSGQTLSKMKYIRDKNGRMVPNPSYGKKAPKGEEDLTATADARTNTLFLSGPNDKILLAEQVVEQLDGISPDQTGDMRVFDLENARAEDLANTIRQLLPGDSSHSRSWPPRSGDTNVQSRVVADNNTNRLIVTASLDQMARIEELIQTLDQASQNVGGMRVFRLKVADAQQLASVISNTLRRGGDYRSSRYPAASGVSADSRTNSLIVSGAAADIQRVEQLIAELDKPLDEETREIHVVPLAAAEADDVAAALSRMLARGGAGLTAGPVQVNSEDDTNSLIISARAEDWPRVQKILDEMQATAGPQATSVTRMIRLQHADADEVANALNNIYRTKMMAMMRTSRGRRMVPVVISASERTNTLLVAASETEQTAIAEIVKSMDMPMAEAAEEVHVVRLKAGDAVRIADTLRALQPRKRGKGEDVVIRGDADSNAIFIRGADDDVEAIKTMIAELDQTITASGGLQAFRLKVADAQQLVGVLRGALMQGMGYRRHEDRAMPIVTADTRTNTLLVSGTTADIQMTKRLVEELDKEPEREAREIHVVPLEAADADDVADALNRMLAHSAAGGRRTAGPVHVAAEDGTNTLFISAAPEDWVAIQKMLDELKATAAPHTMATTRHVKVQHADAEELAATLRQLYTQPSSSSSYSGRSYGRSYGRPRAGERRVPITIAANARTNSLLISAADEDQKAIAEMILALDVPKAEDAEPVRIVRLTSADASQLAETLRSTLPKPKDGRDEPIVIQADPRAGALLIRAPEAERQRLEELIATLDQATQDQARETRMLELKHVSASELAKTLAQVYGAGGVSSASPYSHYSSYSRYRSSSSRQDTDRVVVAAAPGDRTLVIEAPRSKMEAIVNLATSLDVADAEATDPVRIVRLQSADAAQLAETLRAALPKPKDGRDEPIVIQADSRAGALLIRAPEAERQRLEELIATLDKATQDQARETRMLELKHVLASELAKTLAQVYGSGGASSASRYSHYSSYSRYRSPSSSTNADRVVVAPAPGDHTLVIEAPRSRMEAIVELATSLDVADTPAVREVRTYRLADSQADDLARSLARLMAEQRSTAGAADQEPPRFEADPATNQLMVAASAEQFKTIEALVKDLQTSAQVARELKTFHLKAAKAAEVVQVLQTMLVEQAADPRTHYGQPQKPAEVRVAAVAETNDVVVQGPPEKVALAGQLIETLDTEAAGARSTIMIVPLKNAEAAGLAEAVNQVLAAKGAAAASSSYSRYSHYRRTPEASNDQVTVTAELNSNSILVRGPAEAIPEVVKMIETLDAGSTGMAAEVRVYPLVNSEPYELAQSLETLFRDLLRQQARKRGRDVEIPFSIASDDRTRSLVVSTTPAHFALIEQILDSLDKAPAAPEADVQYFWLENADATAVADQLNAMYEDRKGSKPVISADDFTNSVTIIAKDEEMKVIEPIIAKLDQASGGGRQVRVVPLLDVPADRMAELLQTVYKQMTGTEVRVTNEVPKQTPGVPGPTGPAGEPGPAAADPVTPPVAAPPEAAPDADEAALADVEADAAEDAPVTIAVDKDSNSLIISGNRQDVEYLELLIEELSLTAMDTEAEFRTFLIEKADPGSVAQTLDALFNPKPKALPKDYKGPPPPTPPPVISVVADLRTRLVIVRAKPVDFAAVEDLIKQLDQVPTVVSEVRLFHLKHTGAEEVAKNLKDLFQRAVQQRTAPRQPQPQPRPPQKGSSHSRPQPSHSPQQQRAEMIRQVLELKTETGVTQVDLASMVNISANAQTNTVIVTAPVDAMGIVADIVEELDQSAQGQTPSVRMYPIAHGDVTPMVKELREVFAAEKKSKTGPSYETVITGDEAARLLIVSAPADEHERIGKVIQEMDQAQAAGDVTVRVYRLEHAEAAEVSTALATTIDRAGGAGRKGAAGQVRISPDRSGNSVVVRAAAEDHERIEALIRELDQVPETAIKTYPIKNAQVAAVVQALKEVFASRVRGRAGTSASAGADRDAVVVTGDEVGRLVVVSATEEKHVLVKKVIEELDLAQSDEQIAVKVYRLANADAGQVAQALQTTVQESASGRSSSRYSRYGAAGGEGRIRISADTSSNSLVVRAGPDDHQRLAALIEELDQATNAVVKTYPVKNAQVTTVVQAVKEVFAPRGATRRDPTAVVVTGDEAGRLLIVSAPEDKHALVKKVIEEIDGAQSEEQVTVKVYRLKNAQANGVAEALQQTMQQSASSGSSRYSRWSPYSRSGQQTSGMGQVRISADTSSNSLVVRAGTEDHQRIADLIQQLDVAPSDQYPVRLIPLANADPEEVEDVLERVFGSSSSSRGRSSYWSPRPSSPESVVIEANADSRMLAVRADDETFEKIKALAIQLDEASTGTDLTPTLIPLKFAKAATVAEAVGQSFSASRSRNPQDRVTVVPEPGSNSLIVTANAENLKKVQALLAKLDTEESGGVTSEMLLLTKAQAEDLAPVLQQMATTAAGGGTAGRYGARSAGGQAVSVSAEKGSNALVFSGPASEVERLITMARSLDEATAGSTPSVRVIQLKNGDAPEVASMIQDLYRQQYLLAMRERRTIEPLAVSSDARANALILAAGDEMYEQVSQWVTQIETMQPERGTLRIISLKHADPSEVQDAINRLFGEEAGKGAVPIRRTPSRSYRPSSGSRGAPGAPGAAGPAGGRVETTVLPQQQAILISASDEDFAAIQKLAEALDAAAADARRQYQVFALEHTSNTKIAGALTTLYRRAVGDRPEDQVTVTALPDTNALVVSASTARLEEVSHLIEQLDQEQIAPQLEFRIITLKNAQPTKVMPVLQQMLAQVRRMRPDEPVDVQADERTRSVIVTARGTMFDQVEKIIQTLDQKPAFADAEVLIIPLKKADATRLAEVLSEMLRPSAQNQVTPEARALQEQIRLLRVKSADGREIPELDLSMPIKITADPTDEGEQGSNALVISSTPDNLKAMAAIVDVLDTVPLAEGIRVRVIHLANADAESVSEVLKDIFDQGERLAGKEQTSVEGRAEPDSVSGKALTNPLNVSPDLRTNSLVLSGLEESLALAEIIVTDLDRDAGKVVTEVQLFRLKHASAERLAPVLEAVFGETRANPVGAEGLRTQVTRLRTVLGDKIGHVSDIAKARQALSIQGDATTNILVVAARSDVMPLIADVVNTMDVPGAGSLTLVRIVPLTNADATRLKTVVDSLYTGPNATFVRPEDVPTVSVDARTNALVISASESTFALLETLLKRLDAEQPIDLRDIRLVQLENAEAASLASVLQQMMDARVERYETLGAADAEALRVIIEADERSNSLIIGGSAEGFKVAETLARQLDGASPAISGQIQILPLKHANAGTISASLDNLFDERYQAARTEDVRRQKPVILPDLRINALLVAANADDSKILKSLLAKLDVELTDPAVQLAVLPMRFNDAGLVGPTLEDLFAARLQSMTPPGQPPMPQDAVDVVIDTLSNSLIVSANKENLTLLRGLLEKVDVEPPDETGIVRLYVLKTADAQRVASMLQGLVSQGFYKPGVLVAGGSSLVQAREKVALAVDVRTNALIVSASRENFAVIEEIIREVDSTEDFSILGDIRLFALKNADAARLAPTLQQLFDAKRQAEVAAGSSGRMLPISVIPDGRTNTILVAGSREGLKAIEVMVEQLDAEEVLPASDFRIFRLENATATVLQPTLEQLFAQRVTRGQPVNPITIVSEPRTNSLLVSGTSDDLRLAESIIARLDTKPDEAGAAVTMFPLKKGDATQVADTLRALYETPGAGAAPNVGISVDERINAILVSAGAADLDRIAQLVADLDTDSVPRVTEIRVFTLENADASELAQILNDALNQKPDPLTQASPNRQALLQFISHTKDGAEQIASALQEGVLITPDVRTNSLVISAPSENMRLLESLVQAMDSTQPRMAEIRVFTLVNSDARAMAQVLSELFRMGQTGTDQQAVEYSLVQPANVLAEGGAKAWVGSAQDVALTVTVDVRTNSLLVGGTRQYVALVSEVIEDLDQSTAAERLTEVYRLRNAQATDIETAITNFLNQERDVLEQALGGNVGGTLPFLLEREVAIVAESASNTLLLSASPRYYDVIADMIKELDQPPPQVLIQVLLADVTIDDTKELGVEWNLQEQWRSHDLFGGTAAGFSASAGLNLNPGFTVSVTGGDVNFLLRAIEAQGRVEILSRPQVLATDNQEATINIGQRVPFITNSRVTDNGTTINTIQYEDVGIILRVTPRITPDGFVRMEVNPEISSIDDSTVPISEGVNAIVVNNRSAETTVTVQDGHTIVVGGLIRTTDRDRINKVPILGDIPGLGELFRSTRKVKERAELLIVLTPTVLQNTEDVDFQTNREVKRLNLLRASHDGGVKQDMLDEYGRELFSEFHMQGTDAPDGHEPALRSTPEPAAPADAAPPAETRSDAPPAEMPDRTLAVPAHPLDQTP